MKHSPIFSDDAPVGRRRFLGYGVSALVLLPLAACAGGQSQEGTVPDREPFWFREEQRD